MKKSDFEKLSKVILCTEIFTMSTWNQGRFKISLSSWSLLKLGFDGVTEKLSIVRTTSLSHPTDVLIQVFAFHEIISYVLSKMKERW